MGSTREYHVRSYQTWSYPTLIISKNQVPGAPAVRQLDFTPMDAFMTHVLETVRIDAERAVNVFPTGAQVILSFCERVANDVVC